MKKIRFQSDEKNKYEKTKGLLIKKLLSGTCVILITGIAAYLLLCLLILNI